MSDRGRRRKLLDHLFYDFGVVTPCSACKMPAVMFVRRLLRATVALFLLTPAVSGFCEIQSAVNWESFLARLDLTWSSLPKTWESGAFIGNGLVGSMIYADRTNTLQWDVGRSDVIDRGDRIAIG